MATIHDEIDSWLAADLYGELSNNERNALHAHLVGLGPQPNGGLHDRMHAGFGRLFELACHVREVGAAG